MQLVPIINHNAVQVTTKAESAAVNVSEEVLRPLKVQCWPNFCNAIRASLESDLMDSQGLCRACQCDGNSPATPTTNYTLDRQSDSADSVENLGGKDDAKSDAVSQHDAKRVAVQTSLIGTGVWETP